MASNSEEPEPELDVATNSAVEAESSVSERSQLSTSTIIKDPIVRIVLLSYCCLALVGAGNDLIFPLWMFMRIEDGGVGLNVRLRKLHIHSRRSILTLAFSATFC